MLCDGRIDAFATNKGILFEMADELPEARVLDGRWGAESLAITCRRVARPARPGSRASSPRCVRKAWFGAPRNAPGCAASPRLRPTEQVLENGFRIHSQRVEV
jgi:hypothetical protein